MKFILQDLFYLVKIIVLVLILIGLKKYVLHCDYQNTGSRIKHTTEMAIHSKVQQL